MSQSKRQIHLGAFLQGVGHHLAAWRHPDIRSQGAVELDHFIHLAQIAEKAKFDAIFFADNVGIPAWDPQLLSQIPPTYFFEPLTLLSTLARETQNIGLVATVSTSYLAPYHLARKFASLDHLSGGRAGWNLVTSGTDWEANNFGLNQQISHRLRYEKAREYVDVVCALWDSWESDSLILNKNNSQYFDPSKIQAINHQGTHYQVAGPLQTFRPPQGHPVLVQAGSSEDGQNLAAETAEIVFTAQQTLSEGQAFYRGLKAKVLAVGRDPSKVKILPGVMPIVGKTIEEAQAKFAELQALIPEKIGLGLLAGFLGRPDVFSWDLDAPLPELGESQGWQSRQQLFVDLARREQLTLRQLYQKIAAARGHRVLLGTPESIADSLQEWFENEAADGFNILAPTLPQGLQEFADTVIPILQQRNLFRTEYQGQTFRQNLGLEVPQSRQELALANSVPHTYPSKQR